MPERNGSENADGIASLSIALVGTRGVPARYGGFETCVEEVGRRLVERGHRVTVYCRTPSGSKATGTAATSRGGHRPRSYLGMRLVHLPALRFRSLETLSHTGLSVGHLFARRPDAALVFNCANAPFLPVIRAARVPVATHVDGLEWRRAKWGRAGQRYYKAAERMSVRLSDTLIADAQGIADYYYETYAADSDLIAYGAPRIDPTTDRLAELELTADGYHLVVARFEPENHVLEIVRGYAASAATLPLIVVGSAPYSQDYTDSIHAAADQRVRFLGGVWDQELLDQLYVGARTYLHGHSVGGTNPSLLRAIGAGTATEAFDVNFNREVLGQSGRFFTTPQDVTALIESAESDPESVHRRGVTAREQARRYDWDDVATRYEQMCARLVARHRPFARRRRHTTKESA